MPTPKDQRNYAKEAARETPKRKQDRRDRMNAHYAYEKAHGNIPAGKQLDHKKPLSEGGAGTAPSNLRVISKKRNESFDRAGPGGKQKGSA